MIASLRRRAKTFSAMLTAALLAAGILVLLGGPGAPAHAAPAPIHTIDPATITAIEIHKFEQPDQLGQPANGLPQDTTGLTPVPGATFTAKRVPGIDLTTQSGQQAAAALTSAEAGLLVAAEPIAASGTTDGAGNATLAPLGVGLYYVEETVTPAGFVDSAPFVVALPLTNPVLLDRLLTTVHVYPKNARVTIVLDVVDRDAVAKGDEVAWISRSDIPHQAGLNGYRVVQKIDPRLRLVDTGPHIQVRLEVPGSPTPPVLARGTHYTLTVDPATQQVTVDFLPDGLALLEQTVRDHPAAQVRIDYRTIVLDEGELVNEALLYPSRGSIDGDPGSPPPLGDTNVTKWGPIAVLVHERGNPSNLIEGARFKIYLSAEDAARGVNPIVIDGVDEWPTDVTGMLRIPGLRFSGFVDGLDRDRSDPLFRYYYVMPTYFPPGWIGVKEPLATTVFSTTEVNLLNVVLWREDSGGGDSGLPVTGAQTGGAALFGVVLLGSGLLLLMRRRRNRRENGAPAS